MTEPNAGLEPGRRADDDAGPRPGTHLHEAFLERAGAADGEAGVGGHALGAFLTMRLVDQFAAGVSPYADAVRYQIDATRDFLHNLTPQTAETTYLLDIVRATDTTHVTQDRGVLWPPLLRFARWLEESIRLAESLDVLDAALRLSEGPDGADELGARLQRARICRKATLYTEATAEYARAGETARRLADHHAERLSRIGRANVMQHMGNLPGSEEALRAVIGEADAAGDTYAKACAAQHLANTLRSMERPADAVAFAFQAYEAYETPVERLGAMSDVGLGFKLLGNFAAAADAFGIVVAGQVSESVRIDMLLELLDVTASVGDRMGFERWRRELLDGDAALSPDQRVAFEIRLGTGYAAFGHRDRAAKALRNAIARAAEHRLNASLFLAERYLERLDANAPLALPMANVPAPDDVAERPLGVDHVADRVRALRLAAV